MTVPKPLVETILVGVNERIQEKTGGMKISDLRPVDYAPKCKTPAYFIHGIKDEFVTVSHTEENFAAYGAEVKEVNYC